jgi:hypothetical protein
MADTATFSAAMKTKLIGPIRDNLQAGKVLLWGNGGDNGGTDGQHQANPSDFKGILGSAEGIDFVGNEFRIPLKAKRNPSVGFRSENETLPAPGSGEYTYMQEPMRYAYALFNITGQLLKASESSEGAFKSAFKQEMEDTVLQSKLDVNRAAYGDSTGQLCAVVTGGSGVTSITVDTTINFRVGEVVDFVTTAGVVISPAHTVTAVNRTTKVLTISPATAANVTNAHYPVRASLDSTIAVPNNSQFKEIQGLASIVAATGTLHGVNPTTYQWWKSYVDTSGGNISDAKLRDAKDGVMFESGLDLSSSGLDFVILTTRGIKRRYSDTLLALKRFNDMQSVKLHGGFTAVMFDENPLFVDDQCPVGNVYGLSLNKMFWSRMGDWDWMEEDGKVLKWESRRDRYIAVLYAYCQLGTTARNAHFRLTGITDDSR